MKKNGRPVRTTCKLEECGTEIPPRPFGKTGPHPMFCSTQHRSLYDRRYHMKRQYGMTNDEYFALLEEQDSACAICGSKDPKSAGRGRAPGSFHVDHDHVSGKIRGLLCSLCNRMLGQAQDDPTRLRAAAQYLEENK